MPTPILAVLCALPAILAAILALRLHLLRRATDDLRRDMEAWLRMGDTNALLSTSSGERCVRRLASSLNVQLRQLRAERHKLHSGNLELRDAVTNASHDLRTPLTAILGYIDLLEREPLTPNAQRYIAILRERAGRMKALTEELFRYTTTGAEGEELQLEPINLNAAVEEALAAAYSELNARGIAPEVHLPEAPVTRRLNPAALSRILGNILTNAAKYSDGDLQIALDESGELSFSNAAAMLDELQTGRLFDRFYTVESARESTGLGLSIARILTERMGGTIGAEYADGRLTVRVRFGE